MDRKIILASKSPRRQEILREMGLEFETLELNIDESFPFELKAEWVASYLAEKKAYAASDLINDEILICADTVVILQEKILGKPQTYDEAFNMLESLSSRSHKVITSVCLKCNNQKLIFSDLSIVEFNEIPKEDIDFYIREFKPYDKAGSYGIQEWIGLNFVKSIRGSYTNIVGLPSEKTFAHLRKLS